MSTTALDLLCAQYGIAACYQDIAGREHQVADTSRRALLQALGVAAGDEDSERRSLGQAIDRQWRRILPPVLVIWEGTPSLELILTLAERDRPTRVHWVLILE